LDLSIVIPCYNEAEGIDALRKQLQGVWPELQRRGPVEVVLVDDGSRDDTYVRLVAAFSEWPTVRIVRHEHNRGLGAALRTGIAHATGSVLVVIDSDCTYPPSTIPALLDLLAPDVDIVTSSAYHPLGGVEGVPAYRLLFSRSASLLYRLLVDPRVYTWTAMYRAYRREVVTRVETKSSSYLVMAELLVNAILAGYRVVEYPTVLHVRQYGQSKARIWQITKAHLAFQVRVLGRRLAALGRLPARVHSKP